MNQLIKELADQCYHRYSEHHIDLETFAQLLIKECARIAEVNQAENMDWNIGEIIKEHFGLEP